MFDSKLTKQYNEIWSNPYSSPGIETIGIGLPDGSIEKLIEKKLTWNDEPVELE